MKVIMSRRKQSNPKPLLKREDEDYQGEEGGGGGLQNDGQISPSTEVGQSESPLSQSESLHSPRSPTCSSPAPSPHDAQRDHPERPSPPDSVTEVNSEPPKPTLRLNTKLASDPALQPEAKDLKDAIRLSSEDEKTVDTVEETEKKLTKSLKDIRMEKVIHGTRTSPVDALPAAVPRIQVFTCGPCGIRFSSLSTLEAHQTYYCSHRKEPEDGGGPAKGTASGDSPGNQEPPAKALRTGKQYACSQCSYSADKKVSLNRHMRMHQTSPAPSSTTSNGDEPPSQTSQVDRYCSDCDIRFSSTKTYRAHKQHYCSSRHRDGQILNHVSSKPPSLVKGGSQSPPEIAKSPPSAQPQAYLALPTNPIVIVPCSVIRGASLLPGPLTSLAQNVTNPEATCFLLQNGSLTPIAQALSVQPHIPNQPPSRGPTPAAEKDNGVVAIPDVLRVVNKKDHQQPRDPTIPLDLSVRRMTTARERSQSFSSVTSADANSRPDVDVSAEGKENVSVGSDSLTPEQIVCAPSLPGSPPLTPSPKRRSNSPRGGSISVSPNSILMRPLLPAELTPQVLVRLNSEAVLPPLVPGPSPGAPPATATPLPPQIFVKQGVSKCKECNIVFCKYENYLAHKKHYCSARNLDDPEGAKVSPPVSPTATSPLAAAGQQAIPVAGGGLAYQQLICAACGIKFTSLDNLSAHQMYYCPKRVELAVQQSLIQKDRCGKCKISHDPNIPCPPTHAGGSLGTGGGYKCPICDVVSTNAAESRRHMETHGGVKAFRCSICRYKGNTLRGMRTHIRMHFEKKTTDFNEENYITCILEEDGVEIPPAAQINPEALQPQMHSCDLCNYSSSYKGNVVRHIKLVHSQPNNQSCSPSIGEGGESLIHNGTSSSGGDLSGASIKISVQPAHPSRPSSHVSVSVKIEPEQDFSKADTEPELVIDDSDVVVKVEATERSETPLGPPPSRKTPSPDDSMLTGGPKYCKTCDIRFNYLNTFIAHKKFYCKGVPVDAMLPDRIADVTANNSASPKRSPTSPAPAVVTTSVL
ncbi:zinc finger protein ush isoform X2 [Lutzomyia longipalpis]|uniref:zinc finger protein ush isoform X2 n=1 Tax=Lutzomyia longipalpis TaxID=7200 RepID=UPI00248438EC|nr:zinc finger protein ush isoform X2 [Lutzomyia longipalpis]